MQENATVILEYLNNFDKDKSLKTSNRVENLYPVVIMVILGLKTNGETVQYCIRRHLNLGKVI
jgi:hypothetical protein